MTDIDSKLRELSPDPDASTEALIEEVDGYVGRAQSNPAAVVSELPRLLELLKSTGFEPTEVYLRGGILTTAWAIVDDNPRAFDEYYPEFIEATLDTTESTVIARKLLHETAELVAQDVSLEKLFDGFQLTESEIVESVDEIVADLDTDDELPDNGATANAIAMHLWDFADSVPGREQLAVEAYGEAMTDLAEYHAARHGLDPIDGIVDLRARYDASTDGSRFGFSTDGVADMIAAGETQSVTRILRYTTDAAMATSVILAVEGTTDGILRAEAVLAEQLQ